MNRLNWKEYVKVVRELQKSINELHALCHRYERDEDHPEIVELQQHLHNLKAGVVHGISESEGFDNDLYDLDKGMNMFLSAFMYNGDLNEFFMDPSDPRARATSD